MSWATPQAASKGPASKDRLRPCASFDTPVRQAQRLLRMSGGWNRQGWSFWERARLALRTIPCSPSVRGPV